MAEIHNQYKCYEPIVRIFDANTIPTESIHDFIRSVRDSSSHGRVLAIKLTRTFFEIKLSESIVFVDTL